MFAFGIGTPELFIILIVALLVFGPRLPAVMRSIGKSVVEFKKGLSDVESDVDKAVEHKPEDEVKS
jgi:sec-independent protein translocase protein TatA